MTYAPRAEMKPRIPSIVWARVVRQLRQGGGGWRSPGRARCRRWRRQAQPSPGGGAGCGPRA